jgi:hypothetical protein
MDTNTISNLFYYLFIGLAMIIFYQGYMIVSNFLKKDDLKACNEFLEEYFGDESDE